MQPEVHSRSTQRKIAVACIIGNFLEYYDFALYGFFAVIIGQQFFPSDSDVVSLLNSLAVFGVAFALRPFGGVVFGVIGDRLGRRAALSISVVLMGAATAGIGLLPTAATLGLAAPTLLVLLRCIQGVSVGGEWGASSAFLIESARPGMRGIMGSFPSMAAALGLIAGSLTSLGLAAGLSGDAYASWGWRLPFLLAAPLALVGLYIRRRLEDTPVFRAIEAGAIAAERPCWRDAFRREHAKALLVTFSFSWICGVGLYFLGSYMITFLQTTVALSEMQAVMLVLVALSFYAAMCPVAGRLSDRFGRRTTVLFGCAGHAILGIPLFLLMSTGNPAWVLLALLVFGIIQAPINVNTSLILIELFPASRRITAGSVGFNLGVGPPSGFGPLVATALVTATGLNFAAGFFLAGVALVCGVVLYRLLPETAGRNLMLQHDATRDREEDQRVLSPDAAAV